MSAPLCENPTCGHERGLHYVAVDTGKHGRCVRTGCACGQYVGPETDKDFGVPTALRDHAGNSDAREVARDAALIELRLLIAAVHDLVLLPAPAVVRDRDPQEHLRALHDMTRHKASLERLIFSLGNARKALDYFDRLGKR